MTPEELTAEMLRLSKSIDKAVEGLYTLGHAYAQAEHDYRMARAAAFSVAPEGTVPEKEAWVNAETAEQRLRRDTAEHDRIAALEAQRSRRAQLSALQTIANAYRAEAEFVRTGPN